MSVQLILPNQFLGDSLDNLTISQFYTYPDKCVIREELRNIISPEEILPDRIKHPHPDTINFKSILVIDNAKIDSNHLSFYKKRDSMITIFKGRVNEDFPNYSMKWSLFWNLYMSISLSFLHAKIASIYKKLEKDHEESEMLCTIETDMVQDLDEFYDLDIRQPLYKEFYERMKNIDGVNRDFKMLKEKLKNLKSNALLIEEKRLNERIESLTGISVFVGIAGVLLGLFIAMKELLGAFIAGIIVVMCLIIFVLRKKIKKVLTGKQIAPLQRKS